MKRTRLGGKNLHLDAQRLKVLLGGGGGGGGANGIKPLFLAPTFASGSSGELIVNDYGLPTFNNTGIVDPRSCTMFHIPPGYTGTVTLTIIFDGGGGNFRVRHRALGFHEGDDFGDHEYDDDPGFVTIIENTDYTVGPPNFILSRDITNVPDSYWWIQLIRDNDHADDGTGSFFIYGWKVEWS